MSDLLDRWQTRDELSFVRSTFAARLPGERKKWLRAYLDGARLRREWGTIRSAEVLALAESLLSDLEGTR